MTRAPSGRSETAAVSCESLTEESVLENVATLWRDAGNVGTTCGGHLVLVLRERGGSRFACAGCGKGSRWFLRKADGRLAGAPATEPPPSSSGG